MNDLICHDCEHWVCRAGELMCNMDDIPFAGVSEQMEKQGACMFYQQRRVIHAYTCAECGKLFTVGYRPDGLPNGIAFELENGKLVNLCADCLIKIGREASNEKN